MLEGGGKRRCRRCCVGSCSAYDVCPNCWSASCLSFVPVSITVSTIYSPLFYLAYLSMAYLSRPSSVISRDLRRSKSWKTELSSFRDKEEEELDGRPPSFCRESPPLFIARDPADQTTCHPDLSKIPPRSDQGRLATLFFHTLPTNRPIDLSPPLKAVSVP